MPTKITNKQMCVANAKISAYLRCSDMDKARQWAHILVGYLVTMKVYPPHRPIQGVYKAEKTD